METQYGSAAIRTIQYVPSFWACHRCPAPGHLAAAFLINLLPAAPLPPFTFFSPASTFLCLLPFCARGCKANAKFCISFLFFFSTFLSTTFSTLSDTRIVSYAHTALDHHTHAPLIQACDSTCLASIPHTSPNRPCLTTPPTACLCLARTSGQVRYSFFSYLGQPLPTLAIPPS